MQISWVETIFYSIFLRAMKFMMTDVLVEISVGLYDVYLV